MFIANCDLDYKARDQLGQLDAETYTALRKKLPQTKLPETQEELKSWYGYGDTILDDQEIDLLVSIGIGVTVKKLRGLSYGVDRWRAGEGGPQGPVNYQIHVAGVGLMQIDKVDYLENADTYSLQERLDAGWKIIAVCPPNDTRDPTFILGRTGEEE